MIPALVLVPTFFGLFTFLSRSRFLNRSALILAALVHCGLTLSAWWKRPDAVFQGWLHLDELGLLFLSITSALFLAAAVYALGYLKREIPGEMKDFEEGVLFHNAPQTVFIGCLLFFLSTMTLTIVSRHFGLIWVGMEATTLASAPLIYYHRHHRSLEATWKYLIICSVGIALALLGNFLLATAIAQPGSEHISLVLDELQKQRSHLQVPWVKTAFVFFLVGYGTKMGLAPMHTWLPDAHSESPSVVSALLSGALLNCAFLGILRAHQVCAAVGQADFSAGLLVGFGLFSMGLAAVFILGQTDFKRMLAYSSVEHIGILALGVGLGGEAIFGAMLHAVNHSLTKGMLFLIAGNLLAAYRTKSCSDVRGILHTLPISGVLWLMGFLAITGSPPFGPFLSEFTILKAALDQGHGITAVLYLTLLSLIFVGMAGNVLAMAQGKPSKTDPHSGSESIFTILPPAILGTVILLLGVYIPPALYSVLQQAARTLGGI